MPDVICSQTVTVRFSVRDGTRRETEEAIEQRLRSEVLPVALRRFQLAVLRPRSRSAPIPQLQHIGGALSTMNLPLSLFDVPVFGADKAGRIDACTHRHGG
jgi:hypothetical protein